MTGFGQILNEIWIYKFKIYIFIYFKLLFNKILTKISEILHLTILQCEESFYLMIQKIVNNDFLKLHYNKLFMINSLKSLSLT